MDPILLNLGFLQIRWYSLLFVLGFVIGYFILQRLAKRKKIKKELIESYFIWLIVSTIVGARLFEVLFYSPAYYFTNPLKILYVWEGGLSSHGAMLGMILTTYFFTRKHKMHFYDLADLGVVPVALGAAFVRIGNFINQELVGRITQVPWAVKFQNYEGLRHPVQLYEAFTNILIFGILYNLKRLKKGMVFWLFLLFYSTFRFIIEFFKDLPKEYGIFNLLGLNTAQWFSLILILVSIIFLIRIKLHE